MSGHDTTKPNGKKTSICCRCCCNNFAVASGNYCFGPKTRDAAALTEDKTKQGKTKQKKQHDTKMKWNSSNKSSFNKMQLIFKREIAVNNQAQQRQHQQHKQQQQPFRGCYSESPAANLPQGQHLVAPRTSSACSTSKRLELGGLSGVFFLMRRILSWLDLDSG